MSAGCLAAALPRFFGRWAEALSGIMESERDGTFEAAASALLALLLAPLPEAVAGMVVGADMAASLGGKVIPAAANAAADAAADAASRSAAAWAKACDAAAWAEANSDSFSPTHVRVNQRPPAMPRTSRLTCRQRLTGLPLLSRDVDDAKPVPILAGGCTGNGFEGRG